MDQTALMDRVSWAQTTFGRCELGDVRRTDRLVKIAEQLATHPGSSLAHACEGNEILQEGGYRFVRNPQVRYQAILEGGFQATVAKAARYRRLLEIQDSTTLSYRHELAKQLGDLGGKQASQRAGLWVHSSLLVDADSEATVGLVEQDYWVRPPAKRGKRHQRKARPYEDKESYKWQRASERSRVRLGALQPRVITVCDREADVFEYLLYKYSRNERFIVRASQNRRLWQAELSLFEQVRQQGEQHGTLCVHVPQRGGRAARDAILSLRSAQVTLNISQRRDDSARTPVTVNVVLAEEQGTVSEPLCWIVLTSEAVDTTEQVQDILRCYGLRWRIEDFHKAWKSGAGVEALRMQRQDNLLKMAVILAFVAVRLLQLREALDNPSLADAPCTQVLEEDEWKILWVSSERGKKLPTTIPPLKWAYRAVAKLGGFTDTKRTGRASWDTIWHGWFRLSERVDAHYQLRAAVSGTKM